MPLIATRRNSKGAVMMGETEAESGFSAKRERPRSKWPFYWVRRRKQAQRLVAIAAYCWSGESDDWRCGAISGVGNALRQLWR